MEIEKEIAELKKILDERIKHEQEKIQELIRFYANLKGITLEKGDMPKICGQIPMSVSTREEIFQAVKTGCLTHGISVNT